MPKIIRITMFKIPDEANIQTTLEAYKTLAKNATKDNSPYILVAQASKTYPDSRSQGYTLCARTIFNSKEDMDYYDNECKAHGELKASLKGKVEAPPLVLYMDHEGGPHVQG